MSLLYFKLSNGDDIMADVVEESDDHFLVKWPYKFLYQINPMSNILATSVIRWAPIKEVMFQPMKIFKSTVVTHAEMPEIIELYYSRVKSRTMEEFDRETDITPEMIDEQVEEETDYALGIDEEIAAEIEEEYEELINSDTKTIH